MHAPRMRLAHTLTAALLAALLALAGCAGLPTMPVSDQGGAAMDATMVRDPAGAEATAGTSTRAQSVLGSITGTLGGDLTAGRFSVEVPPGAFDGTGNISIDVPDSSLLMVHLHITQVENKFEVPVKLVVSFAGLEGDPDTDPAYFKVFWFDEGAKRWHMLPTVVDLDKKIVSTELEHFSTYGVLEAKAGW